MEKKFLLYLLYITLIEIRERSYEVNDKRTFWLCDLMHNTPMALQTEEATKEAYSEIIEKVRALGIEEWLENRKKEFVEQNPQYKIEDIG